MEKKITQPHGNVGKTRTLNESFRSKFISLPTTGLVSSGSPDTSLGLVSAPIKWGLQQDGTQCGLSPSSCCSTHFPLYHLWEKNNAVC